MYACARHYVHSLPFEFIWRDASSRIRFGRVSPTINRATAVFSDNRWRTLHFISALCSVPSFLDTFCVLFAYFVLRTRRIRPGHFRHVCLCAPARDIDGDVNAAWPRRTYFRGKKGKRNASRIAFCSLHVRELIYDSVFARCVRYMCVSARDGETS